MLEKMDFDIGTLFYIVVTIIAVLAGVFGKKKKAPGGSATGQGTANRKGFFSSLEEQFNSIVEENKPEEREYAEDYQVETIKHDEPQPVESEQEQGFSSESVFNHFEGVYDPNAEDNKLLMDKEGIASTQAPLEVLDLDGEQGYSDYFEIVEAFDLESAVIYSAIINRKEF